MYYKEEQSSAREAGDLTREGRYLQEDGPAPSHSHSGRGGEEEVPFCGPLIFGVAVEKRVLCIVCDMFIMGKRQCFG